MCVCKFHARFVLYCLAWTGFLVNFMQRTDLHIAIIAMVKIRDADKLSTCYQHDDLVMPPVGQKFAWNTYHQNYIIGSFYWTYWMSQILGVWATNKFGTKIVFGGAQLVGSISKLCFPMACQTHIGIAIGARCFEGLVSGMTWPAMYNMLPLWIPVQERENFITSFQGMSLGIALTYILYGCLLNTYAWPVIFYISGALGIFWCFFWFTFVYDKPERHPCIREKELRHILERQIRDDLVNASRRIPWLDIATSKGVWAGAIANFGRVWVNSLCVQYTPMYASYIMGYNIILNGVICGTCFLVNYLAALLVTSIANKKHKNNVVSLLVTRKIFQAVAQVISGAAILSMASAGCNQTMLIVCLFIATPCCAASIGGAMATPLDMAPNFAGAVIAFSQTIFMSAAYGLPIVVAEYTKKGHTVEAWHNIFYFTGGVSLVTYLAYLFGATTEVQQWNFYGENTAHTSAHDSDTKRDISLIINTWQDIDLLRLGGKSTPRKKTERHLRELERKSSLYLAQPEGLERKESGLGGSFSSASSRSATQRTSVNVPNPLINIYDPEIEEDEGEHEDEEKVTVAESASKSILRAGGSKRLKTSVSFLNEMNAGVYAPFEAEEPSESTKPSTDGPPKKKGKKKRKSEADQQSGSDSAKRKPKAKMKKGKGSKT